MEGVMLNQAMVTKVVSVPYATINKRQSGMSTGPAYPAGTDPLNQIYTKGDLLVAKNTDIVRAPGHPQETALPSLNGLSLENYANERDLQRAYHFVGVNKTDYNPNDPLAPKNGLAVVGAGTAQAPWTGKSTAYPGDKIVWKFPRIAEMQIENAIPQWDGKPRSKIPPELDVLSMDDIDGLEHYLVNLALAPASKDGVLDVDDFRAANLNHDKQTAILLKNHAMATAQFLVHGLLKSGRILINTPELQAMMQAGVTAGAAGAAGADAVRKAILLEKDADKKTDILGVRRVNPLITKTRKDLVLDSTLGDADKNAIVKEIAKADENALLWLADQLGVVRVSESPNRQLQRIVLQHLYPNSAFLNTKNRDTSGTPALKLLHEEIARSTKPEQAKYPKTYQQRALDFQIEYKSVFADLYNDKMRCVIGTAYKYVTKGDNRKIDLNLSDK